MKPLFMGHGLKTNHTWCRLCYSLPWIVKYMLSVYMVVFTSSKWEVHHIHEDCMNAALVMSSIQVVLLMPGLVVTCTFNSIKFENERSTMLMISICLGFLFVLNTHKTLDLHGCMESLCCCIVAWCTLREGHRLQNCDNDGTTTTH